MSALAGLGNDSRYLQISAPIQPGNSGGPLFDTNGALVGIVTSKLDTLNTLKITGAIPENVNFAMKSEVARTFLDSHNLKYQVVGKLEKKLSTADVGGMARPFTARIECYGQKDVTNVAPSQQQPRQPPPLPANVLPMCASQPVFNVLKNIGARNQIELYGGSATELSGSTPDVKFCRALTYSTAGKRWLNYTITLSNREANQFWVRVTGHSGPLPFDPRCHQWSPRLGRWVWAR